MRNSAFINSNFFLFIVVIKMLSSLLKLHFDKLQSKSQSVAKISWSLDKINITFKVIEKYQYGLQRTVHLKKKRKKKSFQLYHLMEKLIQ